MLKLLKVRNLKGYSYNMHFDSGTRTDNIIELKHNIKLFATYHITGEYINKVLDVFGLLIILCKPEILKVFCTTYVKEETLIEVEFYLLDVETSKYIPKSYTLLLDKNGVVEEIIDNVCTSPSLFDSFSINLPDEVYNYFKAILYFNFVDASSVASLRKIFAASLKMSAFTKFYNNFMFKIMNFPVCELIAMDNEIWVFNNKKEKINFDLMDSDFRTLSYISWVAHISFIKTGVVVLHNLDKSLSEDKIKQVLQLFNDPTCISMNPAQLIFTTTWTQVPNIELFPEQTMFVQRIDAKFCTCSWQNF